MLLAFTALFVLAFALVATAKFDNKESIKMKAEYLITISWPNDFDDDVDAYVEDPIGHLVCYLRREDGLMHLDRDDYGNSNDNIQTPQGVIKFPENRELVQLRGIVPGEYCINVHAYRLLDPRPVPVTVTVERLNPYSLVAIKEVILAKNGDEKTALRFTLAHDGTASNINTLEKCLTKTGRPDYAAPPMSGEDRNPDPPAPEQFFGPEQPSPDAPPQPPRNEP